MRAVRPIVVLLLALGLAAGGCAPAHSLPQITSAPATSAPQPSAPVQATESPLSKPSALSADVASGPSADPIGGMTCDASTPPGSVSGTASIKLLSGGKTILPPVGIGVRAGCSYWLRSGPDGALEIDAPAGAPMPTLGSFIELWRTLAPADPAFVPYSIGLATGSLRVDGRLHQGPWQTLALADGMQIEVQSR